MPDNPDNVRLVRCVQPDNPDKGTYKCPPCPGLDVSGSSGLGCPDQSSGGSEPAFFATVAAGVSSIRRASQMYCTSPRSRTPTRPLAWASLIARLNAFCRAACLALGLSPSAG